MSYSRPSRIAPSAMRMSLMSSTLNTSARIASPPGNTGRRSSVIGSSFSSPLWPGSPPITALAVPPRGRDGLRLRIEHPDRIADGAHRPGAAGGSVPATAAEGRLHRLELQARRQARALHALGGDLAVAEKPLTQRDAAHLQALELKRRERFADDALGAAAADVDHQAPSRLVRHGVRHAQVDESRLLHAGNDFDRMPERLARTLEERLLGVRQAQRVGAPHAHAVGVHVAQPLPETLQAGE